MRCSSTLHHQQTQKYVSFLSHQHDGPMQPPLLLLLFCLFPWVRSSPKIGGFSSSFGRKAVISVGSSSGGWCDVGVSHNKVRALVSLRPYCLGGAVACTMHIHIYSTSIMLLPAALQAAVVPQQGVKYVPGIIPCVRAMLVMTVLVPGIPCMYV